MAKNRVYEEGRKLSLAVPEGTVSGDPVVLGNIPGVALTDRDSAGNATVDTGGVYDLDVTGEDGVGNSAVAAGDILYYDGGAINKDDANGTRFGYALEAVEAGAITTIQVKVGY